MGYSRAKCEGSRQGQFYEDYSTHSGDTESNKTEGDLICEHSKDWLRSIATALN